MDGLTLSYFQSNRSGWFRIKNEAIIRKTWFWKTCWGIGALIRLRLPWTREELGAGIPFFSYWWHAPLTGFYSGEHLAISVPDVVSRLRTGIPGWWLE